VGDDFEAPAPSKDEAARRALCVSAVSALGAAAFDLSSGAAPSDQVEPWAEDVRQWMVQQGLVRTLSNVERGLVEKSLADWTQREMIDASWRQESIGILLWALSILDELPPYDRQFENVAGHVPLLQTSDGFLHDAELRPRNEIDHARDLAELWHWRSRTTLLQGGPDFAETHLDVDLDDIVTRAAAHAHDQGDIPTPIDGDFPAFGKTYRDLTPDEYAEATSIAVERQYALNWLCGYSSDWDEVPTDT
jgi:hypothetical protein